MKQRDILVMVILTIITCGIYLLVVEYLFNEEARSEGFDAPNFIIVILLGMITCSIYLYYYYWQRAKFVDEYTGSGNTVLYFIMDIIFGIGIYFEQNDVNKSL